MYIKAIKIAILLEDGDLISRYVDKRDQIEEELLEVDSKRPIKRAYCLPVNAKPWEKDRVW